MSFVLTILGANGAIPAYGRFTSCQHLNVQNRHFLIDCGEGAQMQIARTNLSIQRISHIFISHLHGDHYLGLMGLLFSMHLNHRQNELHLYSFRGLDEIITAQLKHSRSALSYELIFHEMEPDTRQLLFDDEAMTVESFPLLHKIPTCGFLFKEKIKPRRINKDMLTPAMKLQHIAMLKTGADVYDDDGKLLYRNTDYTLPPRPSLSYAYCSDTAYNPAMIPYIQDVDLLYHEATFMEADRQKAVDTKHSTAEDAARIASAAKVKRLLIGHYSARYYELDGLLEEARAVFPATDIAIELNSIDLMS